MTLPAYLPILFLVILSSLFAVGSMIAASKLSPRRWTPAKLEPYECGIVPEGDIEGERFPVKFYLVAMLFILFDIETVFLYPWAVIYDELRVFGLIEMGTFFALLLAAYVYVWKRGGLEWAE
ncbi:MAG: NADH-quinone oxidoreductase subunit [Actinomycetota bacterium]|jgi:NADH-quinone oxidoreductase subunit A|nr:NADH-quinone oxidoreductase subunit [Actinomycetota bacterium]MEA2488201.1 NADH-quinone oxidoreductase subunit [Actinomycetota bacterium]